MMTSAIAMALMYKQVVRRRSFLLSNTVNASRLPRQPNPVMIG